MAWGWGLNGAGKTVAGGREVSLDGAGAAVNKNRVKNDRNASSLGDRVQPCHLPEEGALLRRGSSAALHLLTWVRRGTSRWRWPGAAEWAGLESRAAVSLRAVAETVVPPAPPPLYTE